MRALFEKHAGEVDLLLADDGVVMTTGVNWPSVTDEIEGQRIDWVEMLVP